MNFGALNQVGGENRLNVAVTRARKEIIIVCSFDPNKIKVDEKNTGSRRLRDYLVYAKAINESNNEEASKILTSLDQDLAEYKNDDDALPVKEVPLENIIQSKLQERGYTVHNRVGNSDYTLYLAVVHPDIPSKYILGIECDGQSFLSAASTRERDITRQEFLENRGWRLERIWSRNWWRAPEKELDRIQERIDELRRKDKSEECDGGLDRSLSALSTEKDAQFPALDKQPSIEELIKKGESNTLEFKTSIAEKIKERENYNVELKSSFRYDTRLKQSNPKVLEKIIGKTIAAFMNSEGGTLFIGVDDQGNVLGLEDDYKTLKKQNSDGFEIELRQSVEKYTKNKIANESFRIKFYPIDGKEICEITIFPSPKPVFIYDEGGKQQECYVRIGNSSKPYNLDEFYEYSKRRFK